MYFHLYRENDENVAQNLAGPPLAYHSSYYAERFRDDVDKRLVGVYIDITGNKEIYKRPEMVHLLKDCKKGAVNLIFSQTRAYLAANTCDFCFLLKYGKHLVELKRELNKEVGYKGVQLVTISRPTAYGEYAPYHFVDTEQEFQAIVKGLRP